MKQGICGIRFKILPKAAQIVSPFEKKAFYMSIRGHFPKNLKIVKVVRIFKDGQKLLRSTTTNQFQSYAIYPKN